MTDPLEKSQTLPAVGEAPIPTLAQHEREIRRLWKICVVLASGIFVGCCSVLYYCARRQFDIAALLGVSTIGFQVIVMSYGAGFFVPAFLTSLKRLGLSVRMMYEGNRLGVEGAEAMKEIRDDLKPLISQWREVVQTTRQAVVEDRLLHQVADDMRAVRNRVERDTAPVPLARRAVLEDRPNGS